MRGVVAIVTDAVAIAGWVRDALDGSECGGSIQRTGAGGPQIQINSKHRQTFGVQRLLHYVDQHCSGEIAMAEVVTTDEQARHHYLISSLMEEAIRSSQLEGATTSRRVAKELLRTGRAPRDRSERMILNNYRARSSTAEKDPAQARIHGGAKPAEGTSELATRTARHRDRPLRDGRVYP
jgi:hypothetical protein